MLKAYLSLILTFFLYLNVFSQNQFSAKKVDFNNYKSELESKFKKWSIYEMDTDLLESFVRENNGDVEIRLLFGNDYKWTLDLVNSNIFSDNYVSRTDKSFLDANLRPIAMKGYQDAATNDRTALTISENFIYGYVENDKKVFYIEPLRYFIGDANLSLFIVYEQEDVIKDNSVKCGATEREKKRKDLHQHKDSKEKEDIEKSILACRLVEIAIASDFSMFQKYGGALDVEAHNTGVMNNVGTDYDDSFADEIQFEIVEQFTVTTNGGDPWTASTDSGDLLDDFTAWGPGGFSNTHDVGQHWTNRDFDGSTIGLAWVGVICTGNRYHVLQDFTNSAWGLRVLTSHELGHNFDISHDNSGDPFIMAPSVNNTTQWSSASITTMNNFIPTLNCLSLCPPPVPPIAAFTANFTQICEGSSVAFSDNSTNQPNTWSWSFPGATPSSSTDQFPIVNYPNAGTYNVTLTASNNIGSDSQTSNGFITVGAGGTDFFFSENFSGDISDWTISNPDNAITWVQTTVESANHGTQGMAIDNFNYNAIGQIDGLISPTIDFSGRTDAVLEIEYAYTNFDASFNDSLIVSISSNNGATFTRVFQEGENGGGSLATRPASNSFFAPGSATDWCFAGNFGSGCLSIDLSEHNSAMTKIKIENKTGFGNNMFVQYVSLTSSCPSFSAPLAAFSASQNEGCAPFTVQYQDTSGGSPDSWAWTFPGGSPSSSSDQNPTITYSSAGDYNATLVASNGVGSDSHSINNVVTVLDMPTAIFTTSGSETTWSFTNNSTNATSFSWDFGDNNNSTEQNPTHVYSTEGEFVVGLTATNACGTQTTNETIVVENVPDALFFTQQTSGCAPFSVQFTNQSTGLNGIPEWSFPGGTPSTSTEMNPTIIYNDIGVYPVTLTMTNSTGSDTETQPNFITINDIPITIFSADLNELDVTFTNSTLDGTSYFWDFGDSNTSEEVNPSHTYDAEGTYTVTLTATNDCGDATSEIDVEPVLVPVAPIASFIADQVEGCEPFTVQYTNQSSANAESYAWTFEGGTPATSDEPNPTVVYEMAGVYNASLIATNEVDSDTEMKTDYIIVNPLPSADFSSMTNELTVSLNNTSQDATSYFWDFGDTNTSAEVNPSHTYDADGTYFVSLIASNDCGDIETAQEVIVATAPTASFSANATIGCEPMTVQYSNMSSANSDAFMWTFEGGNPSTSTEENPMVTYSIPGVYSTTLMALNEVDESVVSQMDYITVNAMPSAGFNTTNNELEITFNNTSVDGSVYAWDFGDTNTSALENPNHLYDAEGTYLVILTVTNDCGLDMFTQAVEVSLMPTAPSAAFSANTTVGCEPFTVQYTNLSSDNASTYQWTFAGGNPAISTDANPSVTYSTPGTYNVSLVASNEVGENSVTETEYITVQPLPAAAFTPVANELSFDFNNNSQNGTSYSWDFGDSNISTLANPTNVYATEGIYTVVLTVTNDCGTDIITQEVNATLTPVAPSAAFSASATNGCAPFTVQYTNLSSNNTENISWTFEGGTPANSTEQNPTVVYMNEGDFAVSLTASNIVGEDIAMENNYVSINDVPSGTFEEIVNNLQVDFINATNNSDTYAWNFGDTEMSVEENPSHTYDMDGTYLVTLVVTNECGSTTITDEITVSAAPIAPVAGFMTETTEGCAPLEIQMINQSTNNAETFFWEIEGATPSISTEENPVFVLEEAGVYSISLTVGNEAGENNHTETEYITVNSAPQASFNIGTNGNMVNLVNNSQDATSYFWDFGDNEISMEENPSHTYTQDGFYTIILTASNECGESTWTQNVQIGAALPVSQFSADIQEGCSPLTVQFTDFSTGEPTGWNWTFVGGTPSSSILQNPVITYEESGDFDVTLQAINDIGSNVVLQNNFINVLDFPTATFSWTKNDLTVSFTNTSIDGTEYFWNFGDGETSSGVSPLHEFAEAIEYEVTLTVTNECGTSTFTTTINLKPTGINDLEFINEFNVYPNPNNGAFQVSIIGEEIEDKSIDIRLINVVGQVLSQENIEFNGNVQQAYNYSNLASGMYFVELRMGEGSVIRKIVVE